MNRSKCKCYVVNRVAKYFVISVYFEYCFLGFPIRASQLKFIMKTLKDVTKFFTPRPLIRLGGTEIGHAAQFSRRN
jgi:hypothetical protein